MSKCKLDKEAPEPTIKEIIWRMIRDALGIIMIFSIMIGASLLGISYPYIVCGIIGSVFIMVFIMVWYHSTKETIQREKNQKINEHKS